MEFSEFVIERQKKARYDTSVNVSELATIFPMNGFDDIVAFFKKVFISDEYQKDKVLIHMEINDEEADEETMSHFFEEGEAIDPNSGDVIPVKLNEAVISFMLIIKLDTKLMPTHKFSKEVLHHFNCYNCEKWWSIGDWDKGHSVLTIENTVSPVEIICPHCGTKAELTFSSNSSSNP